MPHVWTPPVPADTLHLTLALPGFTGAQNAPPPKLPALRRLLHWGRVRQQAQARSRFYARHLWQGSLLRPYADDGLPENRHVFLCSPLHQQIGMNSIQAAHGAVLGISAAEAAQWCTDLNAFFAADGWQFRALRPDLWRVTCPPLPAWHSACVLDLPAQLDENSRPHGAGGARLLQVQTEIQMLLHAHPLNRQRPVPVNTVWFWQDVTGGADPDASLYSNSPWAAQAQACAGNFTEWRATVPHRHRAVVFAEDFVHSADTGDTAAHAALWQAWEAHWFAPALAALRSGSLHSLSVADEHGCLNIRKPKLAPFWRPLPAFEGVWP